VLNVGHAHVGEFGGQAAIAKAKGELVEALPPDGFAVLNARDPLVWAMRDRTVAQVVSFSLEGAAARPGVWASDLSSDPLGRHSFRLHCAGFNRSDAELEVSLQVSGRHQVANALAAAGAALALGLEPDAVACSLSTARARSRWRMELADRRDGVTVLNDAYNANPDSMRAAVETLAELGRQAARRTWAVLGDMLELGELAEQAHREIGAFVAERGIDRLVAIGDYADSMAAAAQQGGLVEPGAALSYPDKAAAQADVLDRLAPGDVVLVKASRGLALDTVAEAILAFGEDPA
jgi:UDP-N-acetylmuramoyl-tripeptide--D-alanyl-D-alanine ligase